MKRTHINIPFLGPYNSSTAKKSKFMWAFRTKIVNNQNVINPSIVCLSAALPILSFPPGASFMSSKRKQKHIFFYIQCPSYLLYAK